MDLSEILPLLLKPGDDTTAMLIKMLQGGDKTDAVSAMLGKNASPEMASVLGAMMSQNKHKQKAEGLRPILGFVDNDNLGILTRYFG